MLVKSLRRAVCVSLTAPVVVQRRGGLPIGAGNDAGPDSLEATMQPHNTSHSLSVFTLADDQRVLRDRLYAAAVADRLLEFLFDIDSYRGTGRLYLP